MNTELNENVNSNIGRRNIQFYELTGKTFVHPICYHLQDFQKEIILTAVFNNTLISLPPGLGKLYIVAIIALNFQRWFLNSKVIILSQIRSYLNDLLNAFQDYTSLSENSYSELLVNASQKECISACEKSIILTSPQKLMEVANNNILKIQNVVLLIIFETSKITKCKEYQEILSKLKKYEYRLLLFIDPVGFNSKIVQQVVDNFNITKLEVKNLDSPDIKDCTYRTKIESVIIDISSHISSIKDSFYDVFERYGKKLKDAKVITGNVTNFTKAQIQKAKEKFKKNSPSNMSKEQKEDLIDCMTMFAFLSHGIDLLHNWGVTVFYNYLFDDGKDGELKSLIVKDEYLMRQMKELNDYLKQNGRKIDKSLSLIVHPKLLHLKKVVAERFSKNEADPNEIRIVILCSLDDVVDEIDRLFRTLPDFIRYHCIKTKAKCLAQEPEHKEIVKHFLDGVISVLVLSNLVDEVLEIKTSLIISLDPNKTLLKTADARFFEGTPECIFILTKGVESNKFDDFWKEKRSEQRPLDVGNIEIKVEECPKLLPEDFNPEFECSGINVPKNNFKNSPCQKTIFHYLKSSQDCDSPSLFEKTDSYCKSNTPKKKNISDFNSPSLFLDTHEMESPNEGIIIGDQYDEHFNIANDDLEPALPINNKHLQMSDVKFDDQDSFDDLILDFEETSCLKSITSAYKPITKENLFSEKSGNNTPENASRQSKKFSWIKKSAKKTDPEPLSYISENVSRQSKTFSWIGKSAKKTDSEFLSYNTPENSARPSEKIRWIDKSVKKSDSEPLSYSTPNINRIVTVAEVHHSLNDEMLPGDYRKMISEKQIENNTKKISTIDMKNETFVDSLFDDSSSENTNYVKSECEKLDLKQPNLDDSLFVRIFDDDKIEKAEDDQAENICDSKLERKNLISESFVDDLFLDDFEPARAENSRSKDVSGLRLELSPDQINNTDDFEVKSPSKGVSGSADEFDSDCDVVADSPNAKRACEIFSSRSIESLNMSNSQNSSKFSQHLKKSIHGDLFPDSTISTVNSVDEYRGSVNSSNERNTLSQLIKYDSCSKNFSMGTFSAIELPSEVFKDYRLQMEPVKVALPKELSIEQKSLSISPSKINNTNENSEVKTKNKCNNLSAKMPCIFTSKSISESTCRRSVSPVLFSERKKTLSSRSRLSLFNNQSSSIKFDSTFDVSDSQFLNFDKILVEKSKPKVNLDDSLFGDDDEFQNITDIERAVLVKSVPKKNDGSRFTNVQEKLTSNNVAFQNSSTPNRNFTHTKNEDNFKTPDRINNSNVSTPDDLVFDNYSTPEVARKKNTESKVEEERSLKTSNFKSSNKSTIDFPDCTLFMNDFTLNGIELKGKSMIFNSDSSASSDRLKSKIEKTRKSEDFKSFPKSSTMERLNLMSKEKTSSTAEISIVDGTPCRFSFLKRKSTSLFKDFAVTMRKKYDDENNGHFSPASSNLAVRSLVDCDLDLDSFDKSPINEAKKDWPYLNFKKPESFLKRNLASRHSTPISSLKNNRETRSSSLTPTTQVKKTSTGRVRGKLKRNLAEQFLDREAEVSDEEGEDDDEWLDTSYLSVDSFIDDEVSAKPSNMTNYLKSLKSPKNSMGKFHIPVLSESKLKMNVCSQVEEMEQSYENDSFCVDDDALETESCSYFPSVLTQMENKLERNKTKKTKKLKDNRFKRIHLMPDSSPDSPQLADKRAFKRNKRILSSSDSDTD